MSTISLTGADTNILNGRVLVDFADGNCAELTFPNDIANVKTGKNGNAIYGLNESGRQAEAKYRLIRGSPDDKFFNNLYSQMQQNFSGFVLLTGEFIKKIGDGQGKITNDVYQLGGGVFSKEPEAKTNVEGDTEQSVVMWTIKFANAPRAIT